MALPGRQTHPLIIINADITMAKTGDIVRFLSSTGGGRIVRIDGQIAHVKEEDGFETPVLLKELVVVTPAGETASGRDAFGGTAQAAQRKEAERQSKFVATKMPEAEKPARVEETPTGDKINLVLGFQPVEIKHLSTTTYEAYLVNDSNYFLYFTFRRQRLDHPFRRSRGAQHTALPGGA